MNPIEASFPVFDPASVRAQFPALAADTVYFDNPAGTQAAGRCIERMRDYLVRSNANSGGLFPASRASDALVAETRRAAAAFLNAASPDEIVLGPNMTTLAFRLAESVAARLAPGDTVVVTRLDHDANIAPWARAAQTRGARVRQVDFDPATGALCLEDYRAAMAESPRLVAVGYASNALGTVNPVRELARLAREAGARVFVDAVHYAPHGPIDVRELDCDFLACSAYKFFGPHVGLLYGRHALLDALPAAAVRPAPQTPPGKFEQGTGNYEGVAGLLGAFEYLAWLGETQGGAAPDAPLREKLVRAMEAIAACERGLSLRLRDVLLSTPAIRVHGITDGARMHARVPTYAFSCADASPAEVASRLGVAGFNVWHGDFYAPAVTERLGLADHGGLVRVGPVHYNTENEIDRFAAALPACLRAAAQ